MRIFKRILNNKKTKLMEIKTLATHGFTENIHENTRFKYPNRTYKLC